MAQLRQPRIDYGPEDTLRDLSTLIVTLLMDEKKTQDTRVWQEKIQAEAREYNATLSMYKDAKDEAKISELEYNKIEKSWLETGLGLDKLNEMFKTDKSLKVLQDLNEIPAKDWKKREQYYSDKAFNLERKADILEGVLYGDIRKAQNIIAGGAGFTGGSDVLSWDTGDLTLAAYKKMYPKAKTGHAAEFFAANPGLIEASLSKLKKDAITQSLLREREGHYSRLGTSTTTKKVSDRGIKIGRYFSSNLASASERSKFNKYKGHRHMLASMLDEADYYKQIMPDKEISYIQDQEQKITSTGIEIGRKYALAMGSTNVSDEQALKSLQEYEQMHKLSRSKTSTHLGVVSDPDFMPYWNSIEQAFKVYKEETDPARKEALLTVSQELFGFYESFEEFAGRTIQFKTEYMLTPFKVDGQIPTDDNKVPIPNAEEQLWNSIMRPADADESIPDWMLEPIID
jgi:hypothetical protein